MPNSWPLVEREKEFRTIQAALTDETQVCGVVLTGDSGVGKTTLARHVTSGLSSGVRWVAGTESARSIPLGVFAHLVGPAVSSDPVTYLAAARESLHSATIRHYNRSYHPGRISDIMDGGIFLNNIPRGDVQTIRDISGRQWRCVVIVRCP